MSQSNNATYIQSHILRRFNIIKKVGSGAYGHVWKVQQKSNKKIYALKKIFDAFQHATDAQRTYREIQILKQTNHPNIIKLYDTIKADNNKDVYLIFQFMQADLHNVISEDILKEVHIRFIIYQTTKALKYLHTGFIIHRDLKPSNILVNSNCTIKLCDFGLVRSISCKNDSIPILTEGVATRWYRAPQVLLGSKCYSTPADIWSFGCIIYEILAQKPLFAGNSTLDQLQKICQFTGYPSEQDIKSIQSQVSRSMLKQIKLHTQSQAAMILKEIPSGFRDLIQKMIVFNPLKRITIEQILSHQIVKAFHKPQQQIACDKQITTSIDDNIKYSVDQYRKLIYGGASNPQRGVSDSISSTIIKSHSAKYIKKSSQLNSSADNVKGINQKEKQQISKKYSYDNLKVLNKSTEQKSTSMHVVPNQTNNALKKQEKQTLKYVRSAKDFLKPTNYQANKNTLYHKKVIDGSQNKSTASLGNFVEDNKQQSTTKSNHMTSSLGGKGNNSNINRPIYTNTTTKTFYSPKNYLQPNKNYLQPTKSSSAHISSSLNNQIPSNQHNNNLNPSTNNNIAQNNSALYSNNNNSQMSGSWNTKSYLNVNKDLKDKAYLFKSQKYIRDFKSITATTNDSLLMKKEDQKGHV